MKYKEIKKEYYEEKIDAGPQSRILEGTTWDEAQKINVSFQKAYLTISLVSMLFCQSIFRPECCSYVSYI